jgi:hypothetical protein
MHRTGVAGFLVPLTLCDLVLQPVIVGDVIKGQFFDQLRSAPAKAPKRQPLAAHTFWRPPGQLN